MKNNIKYIYNIFGYFGYHNFGDDLMLINTLNYFENKREKIQFNIFVSKDANYNLNYQYVELNFIKLNKLVNYLFIYRYVYNSTSSFWLGGTCLYESDYSDNSGMKWLLRIMRIHSFFSKPFSFINIGIGEFKTDKGKKLYKDIVSLSKIISCRDHQSLFKLKNDFKENNNIHRGGDLASLLELKNRKTVPKNIIVFSGHFQYKEDKELILKYASYLNEIIKGDEKIFFVPMHQGEDNDNIFHQEIAKKLIVKYEIIDYELNEFFSFFEEVKFFISMRLHGVVIADLLGIPNIGITYHNKVSSYINKTNVLIKSRTREVGQKITRNEIENIIINYMRPTDFIENEKNDAKIGLELIDSECF